MVSGTGLGQEGGCGCFPNQELFLILDPGDVAGIDANVRRAESQLHGPLLPQIALACLDASPGTCQGL